MVQPKEKSKLVLQTKSIHENFDRFSLSRSSRRLNWQQSSANFKGNSFKKSRTGPLQAALMWQLLKINKPKWGYGLVGVFGSLVSGFMNPGFGLIINNVLYSYYDSNKNHMAKDIWKYAMICLALKVGALRGSFFQYTSFGIMDENLLKRIWELVFACILTNKESWFSADKYNSLQVSSHLATDAIIVKGAISDRISIIVQNFTLMVVVWVIRFSSQWKMALIVLATFPLQVFVTVVEGFFGIVASAQARANIAAWEGVTNIRTIVAFNAKDRPQCVVKVAPQFNKLLSLLGIKTLREQREPATSSRWDIN